MAYVGAPFEYDIFVSYSHGDVDATGESKIKQWSQAFVRELESEFRALPKFGQAVRIFLDQHHRPSQGIDPLSPLTEQLQSDITRAAIFIVLMSPHYLDSKWCQDEREWWHSKQAALSLATEGQQRQDPQSIVSALNQYEYLSLCNPSNNARPHQRNHFLTSSMRCWGFASSAKKILFRLWTHSLSSPWSGLRAFRAWPRGSSPAFNGFPSSGYPYPQAYPCPSRACTMRPWAPSNLM